MKVQSKLYLALLCIHFFLTEPLIPATSVHVPKVEFTQCPPEKFGKSVNISIHASADETLSGGHLETTLKIGSITVIKKSINFCRIISCPVSPGPFVMSVESYLTTAFVDTPECVNSKQTLVWYGDDGVDLLYVHAKFRAKCRFRPAGCNLHYHQKSGIHASEL